MNRYVCIHGHFYQPPRENPWLEGVELQDSAYPYHDWNQRITEECYRQNAASRILGADKKIIDIVNNYSRISFNFGPTLLRWLEYHEPEVYAKILEADKRGSEFFEGHGPAIAQAYNHIIMPLANSRDKQTQVIWGISDFEHRFSRKPEGMWLPETAVDVATLEVLAEHNIKFTILAPHQAKRVRQKGGRRWKEVGKDTLDTRRSYLCRLPSGAQINLFFYQGPASSDVAYGSLLYSGEALAQKILEGLENEPEQPQLAHIASDGETYGHHYRRGDMALAYCLHHIESNNLAQLTVYSQYLEKFPPEYEVEINENTSWSCAHGIERWKSNCGCCSDPKSAGKQQWRTPLRDALDWLREQLAAVYEGQMSRFVSDPWDARNKYIAIINNRETENTGKILSELTGKELSYQDMVTLLKLLEMQRNAMLMYTSCGWFFNDVSGIETVQILQHAARTIQLAKETSGNDFEGEFENRMENAASNYAQFGTGKSIYERFVKPAAIDLNRVGVHAAISSLFEEHPSDGDVYCYSTKVEQFDRYEAGIQKLAIGRSTIRSEILLEKRDIDFIVLHFGGHNLSAVVAEKMPDEKFFGVKKTAAEAFKQGDAAEVMRIMNVSFGGNNYSLRHLFKDQQRKLLYNLLNTTWQEIEASFRHIYENNYALMQLMHSMNIPLPKELTTPAEYILNEDLRREIAAEDFDVNRLKELTGIINQLSLQIDRAKIRFESRYKINYLMSRFEDAPEDTELLKRIKATIEILKSVSELDLEDSQNIFFAVSKKLYPEMSKQAQAGDETAKAWLDEFNGLAQCLQIVVS